MALVFRTLRWRALLIPLSGPVGYLDTWDAINTGNLANVALPGVGELLRCGYMSTKKSTYDKTFGTVVMERAWDVLAIIVLVALSLIVKWGDFGPYIKKSAMDSYSHSQGFSLWWIALIVIIAIVIFIWLTYRFRDKSKFCATVSKAVSGVFTGFKSFTQIEHKFVFAMYTVVIWIMYVLMSYFGLKAIPALSSLTLSDALFISAVGNIASVIPVPSGMGPYHYLVMVVLCGLYGCTNEIGLLFAVLCHETHAVLIIVVGTISYFRLHIHKKKSLQ